MKTVTPYVIKYSWKWSRVSPTWEVAPFAAVATLMFCTGFYGCTVHIMPDFKPNDYLLEKHADKGKEEWEIFAWAIRDAMAKQGNFEKCEQTLREKVLYKSFMSGHVDQIEYKGKTFKAPPFRRKHPKIHDPSAESKKAN
jgi:hypothetical protein